MRLRLSTVVLCALCTLCACKKSASAPSEAKQEETEVEFRFGSADSPETIAAWYQQPARAGAFKLDRVEREGAETFAQWLRRIAGAGLDSAASRAARNALKERIAPLCAYADGELGEADLRDIGADKLFSLDELGAGECMA